MVCPTNSLGFDSSPVDTYACVLLLRRDRGRCAAGPNPISATLREQGPRDHETLCSTRRKERYQRAVHYRRRTTAWTTREGAAGWHKPRVSLILCVGAGHANEVRGRRKRGSKTRWRGRGPVARRRESDQCTYNVSRPSAQVINCFHSHSSTLDSHGTIYRGSNRSRRVR